MELTSKQFEQLLCEFCRQDLPPNFEIKSDVKDTGEESGAERQIDTKITGNLGISKITICGEAKMTGRKVGSETIDALVGKYLSGEIRANKVILFSNQGYTDPAIQRAKVLGIELLEPKEVGVPLQLLPYIVAIGYLGTMTPNIIYTGNRDTLLPADLDSYIIIKGEEKMSFRQYVKRLAVSNLKRIENRSIYADLSKISVVDKNVMYEVKMQEGYCTYADFHMEVNLLWDYFFESFPVGVLRHVNSGEIKLVNMQGDLEQVIHKVLFSSSKGNYENREDCIKNVLPNTLAHQFYMCIIDPDRDITHPKDPIFEVI